LDGTALAWRHGDCQAVLLLDQHNSDELWAALQGADDSFVPCVTACDHAALLFYDNQQAQPVGVAHAHRSLLGNLPPFEMALGFFPHSGDIFWTASPWMSFEGLLWGILPAWHHGVTVVAARADQSPDQCLSLLGRHGVRAIYASSQTLLTLAQAAAHHPHPLLRAIVSGPTPLTAVQHDFVRTVFGLTINEIWGTVECGAAVANCHDLMEVRPGSPGRATPGVTVEAVDPLSGRPLRAENRGMLAVSPAFPGRCLGHWTSGQLDVASLSNGWLPTGISGQRDLDGYVWPNMVPAADPPPIHPPKATDSKPGIRLDGPRADERLPQSWRKRK
jgi:acetyl-CoA synthetase